jgi:CxxC motif-containing protein (DUF1111 family)
MRLLILFGILTLLITIGCKKAAVIEEVDEKDWYAGGSQTFFDQSGGAFANTFIGLTPTQEQIHSVGDKFFEASFVSSPSPINPGLGPLFNAVSCVSCHPSDGRNSAPAEGDNLHNLLLRISVSGESVHGGPLAIPNFGLQFQPRAIFGLTSEGNVNVNYSYIQGNFDDGEAYELRQPTFSILNSYMSFPSDAMVSPRLSRPVFGLGLLEAIPDWALLANQDLFDSNGDGISGKANSVWNVKDQKMSIGRFGWKAGSPTLLQQVGFAFSEDIGITNFLFPLENSYGQSQSVNSEKELSDSLIYSVTFYLKTLGVPAKRNISDSEVIRGKQIFTEASCVKCHTPKQKTAVNVAFKSISNQTIYPYTDLLLHDMGGGLADNRTEYLADGSEWRTPPLWGIGLTEVVNGHSNFLHDGRARNLTEAILWHGGEAANAKIYFRKLNASDRAALIKFLKSL